MNLNERLGMQLAAAKGQAPTTTKAKRWGRVIEEQFHQFKLDIGRFRIAQEFAKDLHNPMRFDLYNVYDEIKLDAHLTSVTETRKINVMGKPFKLVDFATGKEDKTKTTLLKAPWFRQFMSFALDAKFEGHSLIKFEDMQDGFFTTVTLVPRANVVPELGIVREFALGGGQVYDYRNTPQYWVIEAGQPKDLGLLEKAAPHVIWKRAASAAWSEYCQIFGMPVRVGETDEEEKTARAEFEAMLKNMGTSAYMMLGPGEKIHFEQVTRADAFEVYDRRIARADTEMSKLILGQTMTTDNGSSRSQAEVHERVADAYTADDMQEMQDLINFKLLPFLIQRGYPLQGFIFQWDHSESLGLKDQWSIVNDVIQRGYSVPKKYISETFGVEITDFKEPLNLPPGDPDADFKKGLPGKGATAGLYTPIVPLMRSFFAKTEHKCSVHSGFIPSLESIVAAAQNKALDAEIERIIVDYHAGRMKDVILDAGLYREINKILNNAITSGYGEASAIETAFLRNNLQVFSAFKTHQELRSISDKLLDQDGNIRSFAAFKKDVLRVHQEYNVNWLQSEYQHAVGSAQMARKWKDFERDGGYIKYETVGDQRVRPEHVEYDGVTLPATHPWWDTHWPPNGWKCRCTNTEGVPDEVTPEDKVAGLPKLPDPMFTGNVGKTGIIFPAHHPYMTKGITPEIKQQVLEELTTIEDRPYLLTQKDLEIIQEQGVVAYGSNKADMLATFNQYLQGFNIPELVKDFDEAAQDYNVTWRQRGFEIIKAREGNHFVSLNWFGRYKNEDIQISRRFILENGQVRVYHAYFVIPPGMQGGGFSKRILSALHRQYKTSPVKHIDVHANIDVGGYAWAKYGFNAESEREVRGILREAIIEKKIGEEELKEVTLFINEYYKRNPGGKKFPINVLANKTYGKALLKGSNWHGTIDLTDPEQTQTFEDYLNRKK